MKKFLKYLFVISLLIFSPINLHLNANNEEKKELDLVKVNNSNRDIQVNEYLIGPGDILSLNLFDAEQFSGEYTVLNDGTINFPLVGRINLEFLTLKDATELLQVAYGNQLLRPELHLNLKRPRPIKVSIIGEIEKPGIYSLTLNETSLTEGSKSQNLSGIPRIVDAIQKAGGITQNSNIREVKVSRRISGKNIEYKKTRVNLIDLLFKGDQSQNIVLFDGDIIEIPKGNQNTEEVIKVSTANLSPEVIKVTIVGEIVSPGTIEIESGTSLVKAIQIAGGFVNLKSNRNNVQLLRVNSDGTVSLDKFYISMENDVSYEKNPPLQNGDVIKVYPTSIAKISSGIKVFTEPLSGLVNAATLYQLLNN